MPALKRKHAGLMWVVEKLRLFLHRQERRPFFAGRFFSDGTKIIKTARSTPRRRQKVKPRRRIIVARRQKITQAVFLSIKLVITIAGAAFLFMNISHFMLTSPRFAIAHIGVSGNKNVTAQAIIQQSGLSEGMNIFKANLSETATAVTKIPRVKSVVVRRVLPDEVQIEITERQPAAVLLSRQLLLLDKEGKVIERFNPSEDIKAPVITGRKLANLKIGDVAEIAGVSDALQIIQLIGEMNISKSIPVSEINIDNPDNLLLVAEPGATIYLGAGDFGGKLWRLAKVAEEIKRNDRLKVATLERLDMRFESIVPAKFSGS